jgi:hypothetical protein
MNIFLETLQKLEKSVFANKNKKNTISLILEKYTNQQGLEVELKDTTLLIKTHPLIKQRILIKKHSIIEECKKEGIIITSIV